MMTKHVSMRDQGKLVPLATFRLDQGQVLATYHDTGYRDEIEQQGIGAMVGGNFKVLKPSDGQEFFDAIELAYSQSTLMVVEVRNDPAPITTTIADYRCPRCKFEDVRARHRTFGARRVEELFCPKCTLAEVADSDQSSYAATLARWRA